MTVIDEIAAERRRQIAAEGWTREQDRLLPDGELARAASVYAWAAALPARVRTTVQDGNSWASLNVWRRIWPWEERWWKPKTPRRDLIRAAALIVAEIERLDSKEKPDDPR